jgi:SAM-dependent methyltransferase
MSVGGSMGEEGLIPTTDRYGTALADIVRCEACGHMQLGIFPASAELENAYADAESYDYVAEETGQAATARAILERIERQVAPPDSLLDLGCWVGFLLAEARDRGWETLGVEPSEFASSFARDRLGLDVRTGGMFEVELPEHAFGAVFLGDVIEHMLEPLETLDRIETLLKPGGVIAMALPDAGSRLARAMGPRWWSVIPTHVQYFTRRSMTVLLERAGYEVRAMYTAPKSFSVDYYLSRLGGYSEPLADALCRAAARVGQADRIITPDFRDRMMVIARPRQPRA